MTALELNSPKAATIEPPTDPEMPNPPRKPGKRVHFVIPSDDVLAPISADHQTLADPFKVAQRPRARSPGDESSCGFLSMLAVAVLALLLVIGLLLLGLVCTRTLRRVVVRGIAAIADWRTTTPIASR
jgi:hypothetical protein